MVHKYEMTDHYKMFVPKMPVRPTDSDSKSHLFFYAFLLHNNSRKMHLFLLRFGTFFFSFFTTNLKYERKIFHLKYRKKLKVIKYSFDYENLFC